MISITIDADNAADARRQMTELLGGTALDRIPVTGSIPQPVEETAPVADAATGRKRGEPAPGKSRRIKAEVAEDEAADAANAAGKGNISDQPEDRADPDNPEDAAQDAADEQAEVEEHRDPSKPLTVDDVKSVVSQYVTKFGMPATQEDGPKIFVEALGAPPASEPYWKMSLLANASQEQLAKVVSVWSAAAKAEKRHGTA